MSPPNQTKTQTFRDPDIDTRASTSRSVLMDAEIHGYGELLRLVLILLVLL